MILRRFFEDSLAHASYMIGCPGTGEAIVIDPNRDIDQYVMAAEEEGLRIVGIAETHIHADYVSGTRELSDFSGATMFLSAEGGPDWQYSFPDMSRARLVKDGDTFSVGAVRLEVVHTPGHTPEHISFLLYDTAAGPYPVGVFTGDFVFVGDVGRPDLLEQAAGLIGTQVPGARSLFKSIQWFKSLPEFVLVWPSHGAGSACGKSLGGSPVSSVGYELRTNWAMKVADEGEFVNEVLQGQPEPPPYFARMKFVNRVGPELVFGRSLQSIPAQEGDLVLDVRSSDDYMAGHQLKSLHIPLGRSFLRWAGWLIQSDDGVVVAAHDWEEARLAMVRLSLIGLDSVKGWTRPSTDELTFVKEALPEALRSSTGLTIVDVRTDSEWNSGHLEGALHFPLNHLHQRAHELVGKRVAVHCETGARAAIGASILERAGVRDVLCIRKPYREIRQLATA